MMATTTATATRAGGVTTVTHEPEGREGRGRDGQAVWDGSSVSGKASAEATADPRHMPQRPEQSRQCCISHFRGLNFVNAVAGPVWSSKLSQSTHAWRLHHNHHGAKCKSK